MFKPKLFTRIKNRPQEFTTIRIITDINAGLIVIVALGAIPLSMAFGVASGVIMRKGLITAVIADVLISFSSVNIFPNRFKFSKYSSFFSNHIQATIS
ncbi:MAG: hypothetical protein LBB06_02505 [Endomicrobium sp.]|jgi:SulP family sulfate permease|nr:hypothetical protein [Endomicrobium sp.]